jgi:hypothetical protein
MDSLRKKRQSLLEQLRHTYVESFQKKIKEQILALDVEIAAAQKEMEERQRRLF